MLVEITRGRKLVETLSSADTGRAIYRAAHAAAPTEAAILQQWAVFEYTHKQGSLSEAEAIATQARAIDPRSKAIMHTQAEIARRRANSESSTMLKEQYRRQARQRLEEIRNPNDKFVVSSRAKILLDEVYDLSDSLPDNPSDQELTAYSAKVKDAETSLSRAKQIFPDDADIAQAESRLFDLINKKDFALRALQKAFSLGPRGSGVAIRLASSYVSRSENDKAIETLEKSLLINPDDKQVHFEMAKILIDLDGADQAKIKGHLIRSFSRGDQNFEARHIYAQYVLFIGDVTGSSSLFDEISNTAPADWRSSAPRSDSIISKKMARVYGSVVKKDVSYLFSRWQVTIGTYMTIKTPQAARTGHQ